MGTAQLRPNGDNVGNVGTFGVLCGAATTDLRVRKTPKGPLYRAVCNRWHGHDGDHRQVRGRDFATLAVWGERECITRDYKELHRIEKAASAAAVRAQR